MSNTRFGNLCCKFETHFIFLKFGNNFLNLWFGYKVQLIQNFIIRTSRCCCICVCNCHRRVYWWVWHVLQSFVHFIDPYICYAFANPSVPIHRIGGIELNASSLHWNNWIIVVGLSRENIKIERICNITRLLNFFFHLCFLIWSCLVIYLLGYDKSQANLNNAKLVSHILHLHIQDWTLRYLSLRNISYLSLSLLSKRTPVNSRSKLTNLLFNNTKSTLSINLFSLMSLRTSWKLSMSTFIVL